MNSMTSIEQKAQIAIERIKTAATKNRRIITGHSGGKDSVVIHDLVNRSGITRFGIIHNVKPLLGTSGDSVAALTEMWPETLDFLYTNVCKSATLTFMHSSNMAQYIWDNRIDCQIDGSRLSEYTRAGKSSQFIVDGKSVSREFMTDYVPNGIFGLNMVYPIFDWTDDEVFEYIHEQGLAISREYEINGELESYRNKK